MTGKLHKGELLDFLCFRSGWIEGNSRPGKIVMQTQAGCPELRPDSPSGALGRADRLRAW